MSLHQVASAGTVLKYVLPVCASLPAFFYVYKVSSSNPVGAREGRTQGKAPGQAAALAAHRRRASLINRASAPPHPNPAPQGMFNRPQTLTAEWYRCAAALGSAGRVGPADGAASQFGPPRCAEPTSPLLCPPLTLPSLALPIPPPACSAEEKMMDNKVRRVVPTDFGCAALLGRRLSTALASRRPRAPRTPSRRRLPPRPKPTLLALQPPSNQPAAAPGLGQACPHEPLPS